MELNVILVIPEDSKGESSVDLEHVQLKATLSVLAPDQQEHPWETRQKCEFPGPALDLQNQGGAQQTGL